MFDWISDVWNYLATWKIWDNFWQVVGAILGVLGAYLVAKKATRDSNKQLEKQLSQEKIQHEQQLKQAKIQHDSEVLVSHINNLSNINTERMELNKKLTRKSQEVLSVNDLLDMEYDIQEFMSKWFISMNNALLNLYIVTNGRYSAYKTEAKITSKIDANLIDVKLDGVNMSHDLQELVFKYIDQNSDMKVQMYRVSHELHETLNGLIDTNEKSESNL